MDRVKTSLTLMQRMHVDYILQNVWLQSLQNRWDNQEVDKNPISHLLQQYCFLNIPNNILHHLDTHCSHCSALQIFHCSTIWRNSKLDSQKTASRIKWRGSSSWRLVWFFQIFHEDHVVECLFTVNQIPSGHVNISQIENVMFTKTKCGH